MSFRQVMDALGKFLSTRDAARVALGYRLVRFLSFSRIKNLSRASIIRRTLANHEAIVDF